jgi:ankyrin repeat protein
VKTLLARGADPNAADHYGYDALFYAAFVDHEAIAETLVAAGADATRRDGHGWLAMHYLLMKGADTRLAPLLWEASRSRALAAGAAAARSE